MGSGCGGVADGCCHRRNDHVIQAIDRSFIPARNQVSVDVYGDLNGVMSHLFLDVGEGFALLNEEACECMAKVMETNVTQACFLEGRVEHAVSEVIAMKPRSCFGHEHPQRNLSPTLLECFSFVRPALP